MTLKSIFTDFLNNSPCLHNHLTRQNNMSPRKSQQENPTFYEISRLNEYNAVAFLAISILEITFIARKADCTLYKDHFQ